MLIHADNEGADHLDSGMMGSGKCVYEKRRRRAPFKVKD